MRTDNGIFAEPIYTYAHDRLIDAKSCPFPPNLANLLYE